MRNNLKPFFVLSVIIVIVFSGFAFYYQNKLKERKSIGRDIDEIKKSFIEAINFDNVPIFKFFDQRDGVEEIKQAIENQIYEQDDKQKIEELLEKKIVEKIENLKIEYIYEPWNIKFSYFNDAQKFLDDKNQTIVLKYDDENLLEMKKEIFKEKEFSDWLIKRFDIQKLSKENINNLVFWSNESRVDNKLNKNYYINIGRDIFYLNFRCLIDLTFCNKLEESIKTFEQIQTK